MRKLTYLRKLPLAPPERSKKGFTLLELIVVIVMLAILATIATPTFSGVITRSNDASSVTTLQAITADAKALYTIDQGATPTAWYLAFAVAVSDLPSASSVEILAAPQPFTVNVNAATSDEILSDTYLASIASQAPAGSSTGAAASQRQISIGFDPVSEVFGLAGVSASGNYIMLTLDTTSGGFTTAWSEGKKLGSNCSASVAVLGKPHGLANVDLLASTGFPAIIPPIIYTAPLTAPSTLAVQMQEPSIESVLYWTPVTDTASAPITGYYLQKATALDGPWTLILTTPSDPGAQAGYGNYATGWLADAAPGNSNYYRVAAYNSTGVGPYSVTLTEYTTPLLQPSTLTISSVFPTGFTLHASYNPANGSPTNSGSYQDVLSFALSISGPWTPYTAFPGDYAAGQDVGVYGLPSGVTYYFKNYAVNSSGTPGPDSAVTWSTTIAASGGSATAPLLTSITPTFGVVWTAVLPLTYTPDAGYMLQCSVNLSDPNTCVTSITGYWGSPYLFPAFYAGYGIGVGGPGQHWRVLGTIQAVWEPGLTR